MSFSKHNRKGTINGIIFVALFSLLAIYISNLAIFKNIGISPLIIGIVIGMIYANTIKSKFPQTWNTGIKFSTKTILRLGIVLYGFRLTLQNLQDVGLQGFTVATLVVSLTFIIGYFIGVKILKMDRELTILISAGSSICGAAAVLATESVLKSQAYKSAIAVSTVVIFGTIAMFLYPFMYKAGLIPFDASNMGVYIGGTLHEVAHVVGAGNGISSAVAQNAVIVKMIRVMLLAPFLIIISIFIIKTGISKNEEKKKITIPWFAVMFMLVVVFNSFDFISAKGVDLINTFDTFALTMAMTALGMETSFDKFKGVGFKPIILATILFSWLVLGGFYIVKFTIGL
ncbi:YeiH family protein [Arcobacter sp. F2176]|uniref:YeiH family protein n=1 Tax=Arcobacter sp. F2176 TaxID=2044511 RepID=UPI00100AC3BB|nr:YeiH family protein [Arcobacter sp. F2176]RXJ80557.1 YeiH family putative sulfate export transporter [Arcobacter sp. F2176]